ncbi:hypothetical protein NEIELOOT_01788, partial [Neisseria elongata subsp. glycolytica ATCC 29315]
GHRLGFVETEKPQSTFSMYGFRRPRSPSDLLVHPMDGNAGDGRCVGGGCAREAKKEDLSVDGVQVDDLGRAEEGGDALSFA